MTDNSKESRWTIPSAVALSSYSGNGWKYGNASSFSTITYYENINRPYSIEFTVNDSSNGQPIFGAMIGSGYIFVDRVDNQLRINISGSTSYYDVSYPLTYNVRYELTDTTFSVYIDNTLIATVNHSLTGDCTPALQTGNNRYVEIKDFKIKPL